MSIRHKYTLRDISTVSNKKESEKTEDILLYLFFFLFFFICFPQVVQHIVYALDNVSALTLSTSTTLLGISFNLRLTSNNISEFSDLENKFWFVSKSNLFSGWPVTNANISPSLLRQAFFMLMWQDCVFFRWSGFETMKFKLCNFLKILYGPWDFAVNGSYIRA